MVGKVNCLKRMESEGKRTVLEMEFDGWTVGRFAHPYVEVFPLSGFEE